MNRNTLLSTIANELEAKKFPRDEANIIAMGIINVVNGNQVSKTVVSNQLKRISDALASSVARLDNM